MPQKEHQADRTSAGEALNALCFASEQALKKMVRSCWDPNPEARPNFEDVVTVLDALIKQMPRDQPSGGCFCTLQ